MHVPALGPRGHDSLQYHVVCDDGPIFAARIFTTATITLQWAWLYDGAGAHVLLDSEHSAPISTEEPPTVAADTFSVRNGSDRGGRLEVGGNDPHAFAVDYESGYQLPQRAYDAWEPQRFSWWPDLRCVVTYRGQRLAGRCFAKRYTWEGNAPRYWAYRMLSGYVDNQGYALWTADALFEDTKHNNFKVLYPGEEVWSGDPSRSFHGDMRIRTEDDGRARSVRMAPLGQCERLIRSNGMDSRITQWPVTFTVTDSLDGDVTGRGIYEYVCGTLG